MSAGAINCECQRPRAVNPFTNLFHLAFSEMAKVNDRRKIGMTINQSDDRIHISTCAHRAIMTSSLCGLFHIEEGVSVSFNTQQQYLS